MKKIALVLALVIALVLAPSYLQAQNTGTGLPSFGSFTSGGFDTVNNQNLNVLFSIPLISSAGRGMPLNLSLTYNSLVHQNYQNSWLPAAPIGQWGWFTPGTGYVTYTSQTTVTKCGLTWGNQTRYYNYTFTDIFGTVHPVPSISIVHFCNLTWTGTPAGTASDNSGYYLNATAAVRPSAVVTAPNGAQALNPVNNMADTNGNYITVTGTNWTDSVGNIAAKIISGSGSTQFEFLDGTGNYQTITLKYQNYSIKTNFGCSGVTELTTTANLPYELDIPSPVSGTLTYKFSYEQTPGLTGYYTGRLQQVTLPAGGYYKYTYPGVNDSINCSDGTTLTMNRMVSDGTNSATWNFVRNISNSTTTVTTPQLTDTPNANATVYSFNSLGQEIQRQIYPTTTTSGTPLRTDQQAWATNGTPQSVTTWLEDNATHSEVDTTYDSNGLLDSVSEYDWGMQPIRTTTYTYQTSSNYTTRNILNLVISKVIKDGSGTIQYRQDTTFDGNTITNCPTGVPQHDDTDYPCSMNYRGNPTGLTTYQDPVTPANGITKNFTYDIFGNVLTAQLNCCQNKTWTYSSTTQYSRPDSITRGSSPTQLTTSATYNAYTSQVVSSTDENSQVTNYYYDFLRRPTSVVRQADSATITYTYDDVNFLRTIKSPIDSTKLVQQIYAMDGLGRTATSTVKDGNSNVISVISAQYDLLGRTYKTSNPYTGSPSFWTTTQVDVLGRPISVTLPDSSASTYSYATNTTTVTDPTGKQRKSQSDAAGRLTIAFEPDINNGNQLTQQTSYAYNVLDELTQVTQGVQTRTYTYDKLGRRLSATMPESGRTCFGSVTGTTCNADGYDNFDNLQKRTDARGVLTSYGYDGLNRLTTVNYNVGTTGVPTTAGVTLTFGSNTAQFNNGRLMTMTDGVGSENYTYNNLGQVTQLQKVMSGTTYTTTYGYNTASELTQITYPSNRVVQQSVDAVGRLCEIAPATSGCGTAVSPYATGYGYNTAGVPTGFKYGNGLYASFGFSADRLQLNCLDYSTTNRNGTCAHDPTTRFGLTYSYGAAGSNNGQISGIADYVEPGRSATYTYDPLYRLSIGTTAGSTNYPAWGLKETYDRYGNRSAQAVNSGCIGITCPTNSFTPDPATNRISGDCYDANGNLMAESAPPCPSPTYTYDAENRLVNYMSSNPTYIYDGNNLRVKKCLPNCISPTSSTVYVFSGSKVIAEYDNGALVGSPSREYIYSGGTLLAKIDSSGTKYYHQDHLSNHLVTDSTGNTVTQMGHFPFGESWYNATSDKLLFTSYERDSESGNDYAIARYGISRLGRFSSTDRLAGSTDDPQSLDNYPYTQNDPIDWVDPAGLNRAMLGCRNCPGSTFDPGGGLGVGNDGSVWSGAFPIYGSLNEGDSWGIIGYFGFGSPASPIGGGGGGEPEPRKKKKKTDPCDEGDPTNKKVLDFIRAHLQDAQNLASQLKTTAEDILGLSGEESTYGTDYKIPLTNNFFSLHPHAQGETGVYPPGAKNLKNALAVFSSYAASGQAFAARWGSAINGVSDPAQFGKALLDAGYTGKPPENPAFAGLVKNGIDAILARINCPQLKKKN